MKINKKQVRGILKVLKANKNRLSLQHLNLKDGKITITDGHQLYQFKSDLSHEGQHHYSDLEIWYKLHSSKDVLDLDTLEFKDYGVNYPNFDRILETIPYEKIESITVNTDFIATASLILNNDRITFSFTGQHNRIEVSDNGIKGVILPYRK